MIKYVMCLMVMLILVGCATAPMGLNVQRSISRSSGDVTATLILEYKYDKVTPEQVVLVASVIKNYLESTDLTTVERANLILEIEQKINVKFLKKWAREIVNQVPAEVSLVEGKIVMIDMCEQIIIAANKFNPEDIKKSEEDSEEKLTVTIK